MTDRRDAVTLTYRPTGRPPERVTFEPRSDGRWDRVEETWVGEPCGRWRQRGHEIVDQLAVNGQSPGQAAAEVRGP